ncbi:DNA excision repair ERCC-1 isoform X3 [Pelobates cultripes]|uniref:DNA excision repair protein ERCC-1 n=1 Tax=Pelobates cultripes TaxID=61616 RepID=A0AAD1T876_PELCU|nr:DNA excision repair ERCC-1 isoform X3 [Pelobates cultripes]
MEDQKSTEEKAKNFIIPSQLPELSQVRPLFQATSVEHLAPAASCGTYADYIVQQQPKIQENTGIKVAARENTALSAGQEAIASTTPGGGRSCIVVSTRQRGNPLLKHLRNVPWEFGDIVPDYLLGDSSCALFLSLRYHNLNPEYIHSRLRSLGQCFALRVLMVQVDVVSLISMKTIFLSEVKRLHYTCLYSSLFLILFFQKDPHFSLKELAKICILSDCTLILSWSPEEAARYLETYKCYEQKPADVLKEKTERDFISRMTDCLTTVKSVNKTDSGTLFTTFGTLADIANSSREDLSLCPGLGPQKAKRLYDTLHEPFLKSGK